MAPDLQITSLSDDNGKSTFRSQRLRGNGREVATPARALEPARLRPTFPIDTSRFGFGEIYRELTGELVRACISDNLALGAVNSRLGQLGRKIPQSAIRLCITKFVPDEVLRWPNQAAIDLLSDLSHTHSDVVPLPGIAGDFDLAGASRAMRFLKDCYESVERLNNKPVMGALPLLPREALVKLVDFYLDQDVHAFYVDFAGRVPDQLKLRPILTRLNARKRLDSSLIFGTNARPGRLLRNASAVLSRDFIAFGYGLDVLGGRHYRVFVPEATKPLKGRVKDAVESQSANRRRLFSRRDYGYHRADDEKSVRSVHGSGSGIPLSGLLSDDYLSCGPLFNMEQQAVEATTLSDRLRKLTRDDSILRYVSSKALARPEIPKLRRARQLDLGKFG